MRTLDFDLADRALFVRLFGGILGTLIVFGVALGVAYLRRRGKAAA